MAIKYVVASKSEIESDVLSKLSAVIADKLQLRTDRTIGLSFVEQSEIRKLNKQYADNDYATDVLSFNYENNPETLGDIAVCAEIARKQAEEHGVSLESELVLLILHGTLHLLGQDHQDKAGTASMDRLQSDIMEALNFNYRDFKWLV